MTVLMCKKNSAFQIPYDFLHRYGFVDRPWVYPSVVPLQVPILKGECGSILAPKIANYASNVMSLSSISWQTNASYDKSLKTFDKIGEMVHFCLNSMSD